MQFYNVHSYDVSLNGSKADIWLENMPSSKSSLQMLEMLKEAKEIEFDGNLELSEIISTIKIVALEQELGSYSLFFTDLFARLFGKKTTVERINSAANSFRNVKDVSNLSYDVKMIGSCASISKSKSTKSSFKMLEMINRAKTIEIPANTNLKDIVFDIRMSAYTQELGSWRTKFSDIFARIFECFVSTSVERINNMAQIASLRPTLAKVEE